jgi:hypothetical protein
VKFAVFKAFWVCYSPASHNRDEQSPWHAETGVSGSVEAYKNCDDSLC